MRTAQLFHWSVVMFLLGMYSCWGSSEHMFCIVAYNELWNFHEHFFEMRSGTALRHRLHQGSSGVPRSSCLPAMLAVPIFELMIVTAKLRTPASTTRVCLVSGTDNTKGAQVLFWIEPLIVESRDSRSYGLSIGSQLATQFWPYDKTLCTGALLSLMSWNFPPYISVSGPFLDLALGGTRVGHAVGYSSWATM